MSESDPIAAVEQEAWASTRRTLLQRLRNWEDQESWREFFDTYWKLIYAVAIKSGLRDEEAEEVVQETILSIAKKMGAFKYDPAICSFKGWLLRITRLRILDQFRKRGPVVPKQSERTSRNDPGSTATVERVPDPASLELDATWDDEWEKNLVDAALERIKLRIKPKHYQVFYLSAVKGLETSKIARMLKINAGRVYLIRHRVGALLKQEITRLRNRDDLSLLPRPHPLWL